MKVTKGKGKREEGIRGYREKGKSKGIGDGDDGDVCDGM